MVTKHRKTKTAYRILCPEVLAKIKQVKQLTMLRKNSAGTVLRFTYWYGSYVEDGIAISTYIGKRLPSVLRKLLDERVWDADRKVYHWPRSRGYKTPTKGGR